MSKKPRIFYSALLLTGVNLLLRFGSMAFQVYLSGRIGAEGIGLLQLVLSVASLSMIAAMAGVRTATMYLTAEELGKKRPGNIRWVLSGCIGYGALWGIGIALAVSLMAPFLAEEWIGNIKTLSAIRLFALFLPANCLTGVMVGYFTGANRIGTLAAVEVAEQLCSIGCTMALLTVWAGHSAEKCCQAVLMGSGMGSVFTLMCLLILYLRMKHPAGRRIPVGRRLFHVALPLAAADDLKAGINTVENLMVPKRLGMYPGIGSALGAFGVVSGMVFPVLMFPACILYALAELLIPELARCNAAGSQDRIRYLTRRSIKIAGLYGILFGGWMFLCAEMLCMRLYQNMEAGRQLQRYAILIPMLYCDAIVDAMTKGLGQQKICVRYNILTSSMDVALLYILLPNFGMAGYFVSFALTHLVNFLLSLGRLMKITRMGFSVGKLAWIAISMAVAIGVVSMTTSPGIRVMAYPLVLGCLLYLGKVVRKEDFLWMVQMVSASGKIGVAR